MDDEYDGQLVEIVEDMRNIKLTLIPWSILCSKIVDCSDENIGDWICVESNDTVRKALVEEVFKNIENAFVSQKRKWY